MSKLVTASGVGGGYSRENRDRGRHARIFEREVVDVCGQLGDLQKAAGVVEAAARLGGAAGLGTCGSSYHHSPRSNVLVGLPAISMASRRSSARIGRCSPTSRCKSESEISPIPALIR